MDLEKLKALTKIDYSQDQTQNQSDWLKDMEKIMAAFEKIQAVNTEAIDPLFNPADGFLNHPALDSQLVHENFSRNLIDNESIEVSDSKINKELTSDLLDVAPELAGRLHKVPRVVG